MHPTPARPIGRPWLRLLLVLAWIAASMAVPTAVVKACSCAFPGYAEAIRQAEVAFIGEVVNHEDMPNDGFVDMFPEAAFAFDVERAKEPMDEPFVVHATVGGGGSCGLTLSAGPRWLIIARLEQGKLRTNLCSGSTPYAELDEESRREVDAILAVAPARTVPPENESESIPPPVVVAGGVALLIGLASVLAFRSDRNRDSAADGG